ncbi:CPBP family intramembrane metalloprotease [Nibribacter ruber]|uniref:CPBP family intramembrane metalloprotease n=1 Tax=Nibribacter ruber TaxID=2698458 RepID=A0A6P1P4L8_9BACT|nr:CPBP family intramembrane glutamic endopeptidase [Nibribacter ruber]QHL89276.1 CPBP family intramembrane metalloprotease [Nibribacter ruber]
MNIGKAVLFHLLPGLITIVIVVLLAPLLQQHGWHTGLSFLAALVFITIPLHVYLLLREGRRIHGFYTLRGVNLYHQPMPAWQYFLFFMALVAWAFGLLFLLAPVKEFLLEQVFYWLPAYLKGSDQVASLSYRAMLLFLVLQILVDGLLIPVVEEYYFKGYLLARMTSLGIVAPLLSAALFAFAHFWQPYNYPLIFLIQLPLTYLVWYKKNLYLGVYLHVFGNLFGALLSLIGFLSAS